MAELSGARDGSGDTAERIAHAWRELRRGATGATLRSHLLGPDGPRLDPAQLDALEILAARPAGWRMSEFADALRVDPSSATRAVDRLEQTGLAERVTADHDRRVVIARVTAAGRRMTDRVIRRRDIGMERLLAPFDEHGRARFADDLERFVASIDELVAELERDY